MEIWTEICYNFRPLYILVNLNRFYFIILTPLSFFTVPSLYYIFRCVKKRKYEIELLKQIRLNKVFHTLPKRT